MMSKSLVTASLLSLFATFTLPAAVPAAPPSSGLYADDDKAIEHGDLNDQDYWWTKYDMMMLDLAIKQKQPEGRIGVDLASTKTRLVDLAAKYPKHEGIKAWKAKVDEVLGKINPDANRGSSFSPECPWDEPNFGQLWVNMHWAPMLAQAKRWNEAAGLMQNVHQNYAILMKPDRMKSYPEELSKWVQDSKAEADKLDEQIKAKGK